MFSELPVKAKIAIEAPAKMMEMCIQAKKVLSFAKKTFGSTLMGAFRGLTIFFSAAATSLLLLPPNNFPNSPLSRKLFSFWDVCGK